MRIPLYSAAMHSYLFHAAQRPSLLVLVASLLAACATTELTWRLAPSSIHSDRSEVAAIQAPDTISNGVPTTIYIWTEYGGCTRRGLTKVTSGDHLVTIWLFDSVLVRQPADYYCPAILSFAPVPVVLHFSAPGPGLLRVIGTDTVQHRIVVQ